MFLNCFQFYSSVLECDEATQINLRHVRLRTLAIHEAGLETCETSGAFFHETDNLISLLHTRSFSVQKGKRSALSKPLLGSVRSFVLKVNMQVWNWRFMRRWFQRLLEVARALKNNLFEKMLRRTRWSCECTYQHPDRFAESLESSGNVVNNLKEIPKRWKHFKTFFYGGNLWFDVQIVPLDACNQYFCCFSSSTMSLGECEHYLNYLYVLQKSVIIIISDCRFHKITAISTSLPFRCSLLATTTTARRWKNFSRHHYYWACGIDDGGCTGFYFVLCANTCQSHRKSIEAGNCRWYLQKSQHNGLVFINLDDFSRLLSPDIFRL